ncbi:MAG: metal ABC transporter permease, partial [Actinomycetota bacterium]
MGLLAAGILEPYQFEFFRNGVIVATLAGALCGVLGVFVVLRGMSYIGHGLSHAVFGEPSAMTVRFMQTILGRCAARPFRSCVVSKTE